jgi:hypothetical protein
MKIQLYYSCLPASQLFKESMDILMSPEPSTSTQNHEVCVDCTILQEKCIPMYNLPDVYSTTSTVPSTANLQVVAACSMWFSVNTGSQSWCLFTIIYPKT